MTVNEKYLPYENMISYAKQQSHECKYYYIHESKYCTVFTKVFIFKWIPQQCCVGYTSNKHSSYILNLSKFYINVG